MARAIHRRIAGGHKVFLDCRQSIGDAFAQRFPTVFASCQSVGIDPALEPIPIAPAAHYTWAVLQRRTGTLVLRRPMGGGRMCLTGLHGANRLASNSLLENLVFGARVANDVRGVLAPGAPRGLPRAPQMAVLASPPRLLRETMSRHVGLERDASGLTEALDVIARVEKAGNGEATLLNMTTAARLVTAAALARHESRGGHGAPIFRRQKIWVSAVSSPTAADTIAAPPLRRVVS